MDRLLVILGAPKAGTTSLAHWLDRRPDMALGPDKEPRFFTDYAERRWSGPEGHMASTAHTSMARYLANFTHVPAGGWGIDASTDYLASEVAPDRIAAFAARREVALVCLTRDPLDRAISEYRQTLRFGMEHLGFAESIRAEPDRRRQGWHPLFQHCRRSRIAADIARYRARFGDRLLVLPFDCLATPDDALRRVAEHVGVPHHPVGAAPAHNRTLLPRSRALLAAYRHPLVRRVRQAARRALPARLRGRAGRALWVEAGARAPISACEERAFLSEMADEIEACIASPEIDTSGWRSVALLREMQGAGAPGPA